MDIEEGESLCYVCLDTVKIKKNTCCNHHLHVKCKNLMIEKGYEKCAICSEPFVISKKKKYICQACIKCLKIFCITATILFVASWITSIITFHHQVAFSRPQRLFFFIHYNKKMSEKSKSIALILTSLPIVGFLGLDKLYVGNYKLFMIQFLLTISIIGGIFTIPFTIACNLILLFAIIFGSPILFYPKVIWKKTNHDDRIIAWTILIIYIYLFVTALFILSFRDNVKFNDGLSFIQ